MLGMMYTYRIMLFSPHYTFNYKLMFLTDRDLKKDVGRCNNDIIKRRSA